MSEECTSPLLFTFCSLNAALNQLSTTSFPNQSSRLAYITKLTSELRQFNQLIDQSDLFSPNEIIEDVQTSSLKYLLVPFMFAELILNAGGGYDGRKDELKEAKLEFAKFIDRCDLLMLIDDQQHKLLAGCNLDPLEARSRKINEFKREKLLMPKFISLQQLWTRHALKEAKLDQKSDYITSAQSEVPIDSQIEEQERDVMLQVLDRCIDKVISHYNSIKQEEQILEHHAKQQEEQHQALQHGMANPQTASAMSSRSSAPGLQHPSNQQYGDSMYTIPEDSDGTIISTAQPSSGQGIAQPSGRVVVSTHGISSGGLRVHEIKSSDDAKKPIPSHMKDFMLKPNPAIADKLASTHPGGPTASGGVPGIGRNNTAAPTSHQPSCPLHPHQIAKREKAVSVQDVMTDEERLAKPWFNAKAGDVCECTHFEDVTLMPDYTMSSRTRGGRGKLIKMCPVHKIGIDVCGCTEAKDLSQRDRIAEFVDMHVDRSRVFRDRNPYLMELDDWAKMKIDAGQLPGEKDRQLAERIKAEEERHRMRVENGESDEDQSAFTEEQQDQEQMEAREWADWTDDHQKGAGNSKRHR